MEWGKSIGDDEGETWFAWRPVKYTGGLKRGKWAWWVWVRRTHASSYYPEYYSIDDPQDPPYKNPPNLRIVK